MYYEIYIDAFFLINFVMDLFVLWTVSKLLKQNTTWLRLMFASAIAAIILCILIIYPIPNIFLNITILYLFSCLLMIYISFKPRNFKQVIKLFAGVYIITFLLGGSMVSLYYYTKVGYYFNRIITGKYIEVLNLKTLIITSSIAFAIIKLIIFYIHKIAAVQRSLFDTEILLNGNSIQIKGLMDTGNSLYDPITKVPVIIIEFDVIKDIIPCNVKEVIIDYLNNKTEDFYDKINELYDYKIRLIPFNSIGEEGGLLIGMVSESVNIFVNNENKISFKDIVLAIYNKKLSQDNSYQLLLHPEMMRY